MPKRRVRVSATTVGPARREHFRTINVPDQPQAAFDPAVPNVHNNVFFRGNATPQDFGFEQTSAGVSMPVPFNEEADFLRELPTETVSLDSPICSSQTHIWEEPTQYYVNNGVDAEPYEQVEPERPVAETFNARNEHITFIKMGGKLHVFQGNHRLAAAKIRGETHVRARIFDKDRWDELHAPETK